MNCVLLWAWSKLFDIANFSFLRLKRSSRLDILLKRNCQIWDQTLRICNVLQKICQAICGTINPYKANSQAQDINFIRFATHNATGNFVAISGWYVFVKGIAIKQKGKESFFFHALPVGKFIFSGQHLPKEAGAKSITTRKILDNKFKFGRSLSS